MSRYSKYLLFGLLSLVVTLAPAAHGQGCRPTSINFSVTTDLSMGPVVNGQPPTTITVDTYVSGTASMMVGGICGQPTHQARAYNVLNGVGGYVAGVRGCANCITSADNSHSTAYTSNWTGTYYTGGDANCSTAGTFWGSLNSFFDAELAATTSQNTGSRNTNSWNLANYCVPASLQADWSPTYVIGPIASFPVFQSENLCARPHGSAAGTPWACPPTVFIDAYTSSHPRGNCTVHDLGLEGDFSWMVFMVETGWVAIQ